MNLERFKVKHSIAISALFLVATSVNAEKKEITEEDIDKAIERLNSRIESFPNEEPDYPRFTRVALDYSILNGNVNDQRDTDFFGGPFADGSNDSNILRASTNIQLSKDFSAGLSVGMINGDSSIRQGDVPEGGNIVSSDSDGTSFGASLRYQINDWLAAGIFAGWSSGDGSSVDTFGPPANTGTFKFTGQTQGAYLAATKAITDQWVYSISPSFTHSKSKSKYYNDDVAGETITNYELNMWHVDQNISYYFDKYRARLTGGHTYHNVAHETETNSAPRSNSNTLYVGGSYLVSVSHGLELYGIGSKEFSDDIYDEASSVTFGIAKNF
jgi:hypothetical protein